MRANTSRDHLCVNNTILTFEKTIFETRTVRSFNTLVNINIAN
jgi:hypothetical protein